MHFSITGKPGLTSSVFVALLLLCPSIMRCALVLVSAKVDPAPLVLYAWQVALSVPARLVFAPLPPHIEALAEPLAFSETAARLIAAATLGAFCPVVEWPAQLPFPTALEMLLDEHRATSVLISSPYAGQAVPRIRALTPVLNLLTQPPCLVLVHPPQFAQTLPHTVLALGPQDRKAGTPGWLGTIAYQLLQAWRPRIIVPGVAALPHGVTSAPMAWQSLLTGLSQTRVVTSLLTPSDILAEATRCHADLLLVILRVREASRDERERRTLLMALLQSPVPVLLVPLIG